MTEWQNAFSWMTLPAMLLAWGSFVLVFNRYGERIPDRIVLARSFHLGCTAVLVGLVLMWNLILPTVIVAFA